MRHLDRDRSRSSACRNSVHVDERGTIHAACMSRSIVHIVGSCCAVVRETRGLTKRFASTRLDIAMNASKHAALAVGPPGWAASTSAAYMGASALPSGPYARTIARSTVATAYGVGMIRARSCRVRSGRRSLFAVTDATYGSVGGRARRTSSCMAGS